MSAGTKTTEGQALLVQAAGAAARRDLGGMLEALFASGFLDGLTRRLQKQWQGRLGQADVDECIAYAVDAAYEAAAKGKAARELGPWLWKAAQNTATDRWKAEHSHRHREFDGFDDIAGQPDHDDAERWADDEMADHQRREAFRIAREILPRIGTGQVVDVIALVIEAAEQGVPDLPASAVADALGISEAAARTLTSRGLARLRREAQKIGIAFPDSIPEPEPADTEEDAS